MIRQKGLALSFALVLLAVVSPSAHAREAELSAQAEKCLQCHAKEGARTNFPEDAESVPARVVPADFKASVHGVLDCTACHGEYPPGIHPKKRFRSREQFRAATTSACRRCHSNGQIRGTPIHASFLKREREGEVPVCTDCH